MRAMRCVPRVLCPAFCSLGSRGVRDGAADARGTRHAAPTLELAVDDLAAQVEELARERYDVLDREILERVE